MNGLDVDRALDFFEFAVERHRVFDGRQSGTPGPWTDHPVLRVKKFTNVYRVLDYGSQFLLRELLDPELPPDEILMRCWLYRATNLPETWEYVKRMLGRYPLIQDLNAGLVELIESKPIIEGGTIYSGAYMIAGIVYGGGSQPSGPDKTKRIIEKTQGMFHGHTLVADFLEASTPENQFKVLRSIHGVGDFMAMQVLTDWGYSSQCGIDRENDFVMPGPGALRGAKALAPGWDVPKTLHWAREVLWGMVECPRIETPQGALRPPSLMDVQNLCCEFSKLVRYMGKPLPAKTYSPAHPGPQQITLPSHW